MTSEAEETIRISKLEERVLKLEKMLIEKEDLLNDNFEGFEVASEDDLVWIKKAEWEFENKTVSALDKVLEDME